MWEGVEALREWQGNPGWDSWKSSRSSGSTLLEPTCVCVNLSARLPPPSPLHFHRFAAFALCFRRFQTGHLSLGVERSTESFPESGKHVR